MGTWCFFHPYKWSSGPLLTPGSTRENERLEPKKSPCWNVWNCHIPKLHVFGFEMLIFQGIGAPTLYIWLVGWLDLYLPLASRLRFVIEFFLNFFQRLWTLHFKWAMNKGYPKCPCRWWIGRLLIFSHCHFLVAFAQGTSEDILLQCIVVQRLPQGEWLAGASHAVGPGNPERE